MSLTLKCYRFMLPMKESLLMCLNEKVETWCLVQFTDAIYRRPGLPLRDFIQELNLLLLVLTRDNRKVLLSGDFNKDLLKIGEHELTQEFLNVMNLFSLNPTIN